MALNERCKNVCEEECRIKRSFLKVYIRGLSRLLREDYHENPDSQDNQSAGGNGPGIFGKLVKRFTVVLTR